MNKRLIYEKIVQITRKIYKIDLAEKLFFAVEQHDKHEFDRIFKNFATNDPKLFEQIKKFKELCHKELKENSSRLVIFGEEENARKSIRLFNPNIIDAPSFLILTFCLMIDDATFFDIENSIKALTTYVNAINANGYRRLATFLYEESWIKIYNKRKYNTLYNLLEAIFDGDYE